MLQLELLFMEMNREKIRIQLVCREKETKLEEEKRGSKGEQNVVGF